MSMTRALVLAVAKALTTPNHHRGERRGKGRTLHHWHVTGWFGGNEKYILERGEYFSGKGYKYTCPFCKAYTFRKR
jgi:hypothetical protein